MSALIGYNGWDRSTGGSEVGWECFGQPVTWCLCLSNQVKVHKDTRFYLFVFDLQKPWFIWRRRRRRDVSDGRQDGDYSTRGCEERRVKLAGCVLLKRVKLSLQMCQLSEHKFHNTWLIFLFSHNKAPTKWWNRKIIKHSLPLKEIKKQQREWTKIGPLWNST